MKPEQDEILSEKSCNEAKIAILPALARTHGVLMVDGQVRIGTASVMLETAAKMIVEPVMQNGRSVLGKQ